MDHAWWYFRYRNGAYSTRFVFPFPQWLVWFNDSVVNNCYLLHEAAQANYFGLPRNVALLSLYERVALSEVCTFIAVCPIVIYIVAIRL